MQEASFNGFIRTILIIVGLYYAFKILFRIFAPILMKTVIKKAESNFRKQQEQYQSFNQDSYSQYNTSKNQQNKQTPKTTKKVGEYIDYEEIE